MLHRFHKTSLVLLLLFSILSVFYSIEPKYQGAEFSFNNKPQFDMSITAQSFKNGLRNFTHIKGFFIMSLLALVGIRKKKFIYTISFVLILTLITEFLQAWSPSRHARIADAIPNIIGLILGIGLYCLGSFLLKKSRICINLNSR